MLSAAPVEHVEHQSAAVGTAGALLPQLEGWYHILYFSLQRS